MAERTEEALDPAIRVLRSITRRAATERIPLNGSIAMTHRCHLRCVHCYLGDQRLAAPEGGELPTGFWLSLLDQAVEAGCLKLLITGGEPLLRSDFASVYAHAVRSGLLVAVFTNGTLLDERVVALFRELPPRRVEITLYGASAEVYARVTGVAGMYERCLRGVDALVAAGVRVALKAVLLTDNQHEIPRMREMARERGLAFRTDAAVFPRFSGDQAPLARRIPVRDAVRHELHDDRVVARTRQYLEDRRDARVIDRVYSCMAGTTTFHVDARGRLSPCLMVTDCTFDLRGAPFSAGWEEMRQFNQAKAPSGYECHTCERRFVCMVCPGQSALETGSPALRSEYNCRLAGARMEVIGASGRRELAR